MLIDDAAGSVISVTSEKNAWRKVNLSDAHRSKRWRSTSDGEQKIVCKLPTGTLPTLFLLGDSNLDAAEAVTLKQASDEAITADVATWNLTSYTQSKRAIMRWYLGAADSGTADSANAYWEITLPNNGSASTDYHQLGLVWFGIQTELAMASIGRAIMDPSLVAMSDGGARYPDVRPTYHETAIDSEGMPEADTFALMDIFDTIGSTRHIVLDLWAASSDDTKKANGCYYGTLADEVAGIERGTPLYDDVSIQLIEARA